MIYTHHLVWTSRSTSGNLKGLDLIHGYPTFDDVRTKAHMAALVKADNVDHVHLVCGYN